MQTRQACHTYKTVKLRRQSQPSYMDKTARLQKTGKTVRHSMDRRQADRQIRQSAALTFPPARVELRTATDTALNTSS